MDDDTPSGRITFDEPPGYERWGVAVGGAVVGFFIFGYFGLRFFRHADGFVVLLFALLGAGAGAWLQVKRGDSWWKRL